MTRTAFAAALALTLPLLTSAPAFAETVSTQDFVNKVAISDMFEIQSGDLAAKKAKHEDVQEFGEEMVEDHTATSKDLKALVKDEDIKATLPAELDEAHKAKLDELNSASGEAFDKTYVPMQVAAHEKAVSLFAAYAESGDNEALKNWAGDTLPALKEHLKEAKALNTEIAKPAQTAEADDATPMAEPKTDKAMDDKAMAEKVTEETDVKGTEEQAKDEKPTPPAFNYVTRQEPTDWTAQALLGRTVQNEGGQTLGEINNVILNEKGKVVAVTIGVGGFLGLGEKDVGVPFDALKFRSEDAMEKKAETETDKDAKTEDKTTEAVDADDPSHSDIVVVVDATKEQLEAAPTFVWLGEKREKRAATDSETTVE
jgi:putative membrane protein